MKKYLVIAFLLVSVSSFAQQKGDVGFNFKYGFNYTNVGVTFHSSEKIILRPSVQFSKSTSEGKTNNYKNESKETNFGLGFSCLFAMKNTDDLLIYWGGDFSYSIVNLEELYFENFDNQITNETSTGKGNNRFVGILLGFQHRLQKRVSIYGELGAGYSASKYPSGDEYKYNQSSFGLNNYGFGIIIYCN